MTTIFLIFAGTNTSWQSEAQNGYFGTENHSSSALLRLETKTDRVQLGLGEGDRWQTGHSVSGNPSTAALPPPHRKVAKQNHTPLLEKIPQKPNKMKKITKLRLIVHKDHRGKGECSAGNALALRARRPESAPTQSSQACSVCVEPSIAADTGGFPRLVDWSASLT